MSSPIIFHGEGTFLAFYAAEKFLEGAGFSVGSTSVGDPVPVMFGNYHVAKWRNLTKHERDGVHCLIEGNRREGPVTVRLTDACPAAGKEALEFAAIARATPTAEGVA